MIRVVVLCMLLLPLAAVSQDQFAYMKELNFFLHDGNGNPLKMKTHYELEGSPYYYPDYCVANIKVMRGKRYSGLLVMLNLEDNRVIYKMPDGQEWESSVQIETIDFAGCDEKGKPATFRSGFPPVDNQTHRSYYQVLDSGNIQLLKFQKISYADKKPYSSAITVRKYDAAAVYYAYSPGKEMVALGKGNEHATVRLLDKKAQVDKFMTEKNIRVKKEEDLIKLFNFYNALR